MRTKLYFIPLAMFIAILLTFILSQAKAQDKSLVLTPQSLQNAQIVLPQNTTAGYTKFATLLQKRLQQSLGQSVTIVAEDKASADKILFHIGPTKACVAAVPEQQDLPLHTYVIRSDGKSNIYFAGPAEFTVGFAVVEFADKVLNIRQYMPAPLGEFITKSQSVTVPAEIKAPKPDLASVYYSGMQQPQKGEVYSTPYIEMTLEYQLYKSDEFHHNLYRIFPAEKYAATHPEYYAATPDGVRHLPSNKYNNLGLIMGWQPCLTNPDVLKITIDYCLDWFKTHPDATSVSIALNDGAGDCQCDKCLAAMKQLGKPDSNLYYDFANKVARAVAKEMPGKMVGFSGYGIGTNPPSFPIEKNVLVYKVHPERKGLAPWGDLGASTGVYTWLYGTSYVTPRYFPHEFQRYLKKWEEQGAKGLYAETYPNWIVDAPMIYIVSKMARNINVNIDALMQQYTKDMYGSAAADIIEFYQVNERAMARREKQPYLLDDFNFMSNVGRPLKYQFICWRVEDVEQMDKALEKASSKVAAGTIEAHRLDLLKNWWKMSRLFILSYKKADAVAEMPINSAEDAQKTAPFIIDTLENVQQTGDLWNSKFSDLSNNQEQSVYYRYETSANQNQLSCFQWIDPKVWPLIAIDETLKKATENFVKKLGRKKTMELWQDLATKYPKAESAFLAQKTLASGELVNVVENGSFEKLDPLEKKYRTPLGFMYWNTTASDIGIDEKIVHSGKHSWTHGLGSGAWLDKTVSVMPHSKYLISVWIRKAKPNNGNWISILMAEKSSGNKMVMNVKSTPPPDVPANTWYNHQVIVTVPDYCDKMSLDLACKNFSDEGDRVWFDDLEAYRLY